MMDEQIPPFAWVEHEGKDCEGNAFRQSILIEASGWCLAIIVHPPPDATCDCFKLYRCDLKFGADDRFYIDLAPAKRYVEAMAVCHIYGRMPRERRPVKRVRQRVPD